MTRSAAGNARVRDVRQAASLSPFFTARAVSVAPRRFTSARMPGASQPHSFRTRLSPAHLCIDCTIVNDRDNWA